MEERDFFKQPFSADEVRSLLDGESPRVLFNFKSQAFKKSGLVDGALTDDDLIRLLSEEPRYFKRPIVVASGKLLAGATAKQLQSSLGI